MAKKGGIMKSFTLIGHCKCNIVSQLEVATIKHSMNPEMVKPKYCPFCGRKLKNLNITIR